MSVTFEEAWRQRLGTKDGELFFKGTGTGTIADAYAALASVAPSSLGGLPLDNLDVQEFEGGEAWDGTANYKTADFSSAPREIGSVEVEGDTSGGTQHIKQSRSNLAIYSRASTLPAAPDTHGAINAFMDQGRVRVDGADIVVPQYAFTITKVFTSAAFTDAYKAILLAQTATVNNGTFKGLAAGECLFLGATWRSRSDGGVPVSLRFAGSPNRTSYVINPSAPGADQITVASKKGWEFLWVMYEPQADSTNKLVVPRPIGAYVEKVYEESDFSNLGVGT